MRVLGVESVPDSIEKHLHIQASHATCLARMWCCDGRGATVSSSAAPSTCVVVLEMRSRNLAAHGWLVVRAKTSPEGREGSACRRCMRSIAHGVAVARDRKSHTLDACWCIVVCKWTS